MTTQTTPNNADLFLEWLNFQKNERLLRLKSANGTASTIVANVIGGISGNGRRSMHGLLTTTKRMQCFALRVVAVGVGKIPVRLESGKRNADVV